MIIVVSFFADLEGCCPAEWLDDKIHALEALNKKYLLVCGAGNGEKYGRKCIQVPSLSFNDWKTDLKEMKRLGKRIKPQYYLMLPFVITFGLLWDLIYGISGGRTSWFFMVFPVLCYLLLTRKIDSLFATGGPYSAALATSMSGKIFRKNVVVEFQDPIVSSSFNGVKYKIACLIEKIIVFCSDSIVFVTKKACVLSRSRNLSCQNKIKQIYPGAWNLHISSFEEKNEVKVIRVVHLGTLYGDRHIDALITAVDEINKEKSCMQFEVINVGAIYNDKLKEYCSKDFFKLEKATNRVNALKFAAQCDIMILAQHESLVSYETIPYKFYDYLNLNKPIIALRINKEIDTFLADDKGVAVLPQDVGNIKKYLLNFLVGKSKSNHMYNQYNRQFIRNVEALFEV